MTETISSTDAALVVNPDGSTVRGDREGLTKSRLSPRQMAFKRFLHHKGAVVCTVIMAMMILFVVLAPITARYGVNERIFDASAGQPNSFLSPRSEAWFGTDAIGRDLYSRLIFGLRVSLVIGLFAAVFATILGITAGSIAGLRGGRFDDVLMRVTDIFLAFPFLVALLVVRNFLGEVSFLEPIVGEKTSLRFIIILFTIFGWMGVARLVRGQILALKEREFVEAARALGASNTRIIIKHLIPNAIGPILVALTTAVVAAVIAESTLAFFGFGPDAGSGNTSLGNLVGDSKSAVQAGQWWLVLFPCGLLVLVAMCINFIGDGLRDATDPKLLQDSGS